MKNRGVLLHISSLPSPYGIGTLGVEAYNFVDFLAKSGQAIWQILPIGPTSYGDSPYSALSAFAFNPYFIDLDLLVKENLINADDLPVKVNSGRVNYENLFNTRYKILNKAYQNRYLVKDEFELFIKEEAYWLNDYALFMVIKKNNDNKAWNEWPDGLKYKRCDAIRSFTFNYSDEINEYKFYQFLAFRQWNNLKKYANKKGISIMGDMPIYCAYDSSDVWATPHYFRLDNELKPTFVAGCPPDGFSPDGQLWGNPLYNYDLMKKNNYFWWVKRVKHSLKLFDILRIDHFRGFAGYYAIPYGDKTAKNGHWEKGPKYRLFKAIKNECPNANIVAENLGFLTKDVFELLDKCEYPGMNIFQFELGDGKNRVPLKKGFKENNIFYSGTHDNQTIMSFYNELDENNKKLIDKLCDIKFTDRPNLKIIEFCMKQACKYTIIPLQDYLGLTDDLGRMNIPSTSMGNWTYRTRKSDFSEGLSAFMLEVSKLD